MSFWSKIGKIAVKVAVYAAQHPDQVKAWVDDVKGDVNDVKVVVK